MTPNTPLQKINITHVIKIHYQTVWPWYIAVSYTHLDVYKRQVLNLVISDVAQCLPEAISFWAFYKKLKFLSKNRARD